MTFWTQDQLDTKIDPAQAATILGNTLNILTDRGGTAAPPDAPPAETTTVPTSDGTQSPVPTDTPISQGFGVSNDHEQGHPGVDFAVPVGTPVLAATSGTVTVASGGQGGYGNLVEITGPDGTITRYGHLSGIEAQLGTTVKEGQKIGVSGGQAGAEGAGNSTGPHLHFEVHTPAGQLEDPIAFLAGGAKIVGEAPVTPAASATPTGPDVQLNRQNSGDAFNNLSDPATASTSTTDATGVDAVTGQGGGDFFGQVLSGVGAPDTPENRRALQAWQQAEGGSADNPFNTTQDAPGAVSFNSVGVKRYPDMATGVQATIRTLLNGRYGNIISALKSGKDAMSVADAITNSPWGTGGLVTKVLLGG